MKWLIVLVATLALASAVVQQQENVILRCQSGNQLTISRQGNLLGGRILEIEVVGPQIIPEKVQIDDDQLMMTSGIRGTSSLLVGQAVLLAEILNNQPIDETTCEILVNEIRKSIQIDQISNGLTMGLQLLEQGTMMDQNLAVSTSNLNCQTYGCRGQKTPVIMTLSGMSLVQDLPMVQRSIRMWPMNQQVVPSMNSIGIMTPNNLRKVLYGQQPQREMLRMMMV